MTALDLTLPTYRDARVAAPKKRPKRVPATQRPTNPLTGLLSAPVLIDRWFPDELAKVKANEQRDRNKRKAERRRRAGNRSDAGE